MSNGAKLRRVMRAPHEGISNPDEGVYIMDVDGYYHKSKEWTNNYEAECVAVVTTGGYKLGIALDQKSLMMYNTETYVYVDNFLVGRSDEYDARSDYNGQVNTTNILKAINSVSYAAGYCDFYEFPSRERKGYLPALGQLTIIYEYRDEIDEALEVSGGTTLYWMTYWSSTYYGMYGSVYCGFWALNLHDNEAMDYHLPNYLYVRPVCSLD